MEVRLSCPVHFCAALWPVAAKPAPDPARPASRGRTRHTRKNRLSQRGEELFRSVHEILQFASEDTGLPIEHKVKRRLTKRDEVQSYIEKSMKDDKDAKPWKRSSAVLKKFGLIPRNFDLSKFLVTMLREQVAGTTTPKRKR